jgi:hypothetical protein
MPLNYIAKICLISFIVYLSEKYFDKTNDWFQKKEFYHESGLDRFFSICSGLVPWPPADTKVHGYSSSLYKMV